MADLNQMLAEAREGREGAIERAVTVMVRGQYPVDRFADLSCSPATALRILRSGYLRDLVEEVHRDCFLLSGLLRDREVSHDHKVAAVTRARRLGKETVFELDDGAVEANCLRFEPGMVWTLSVSSSWSCSAPLIDGRVWLADFRTGTLTHPRTLGVTRGDGGTIGQFFRATRAMHQFVRARFNGRLRAEANRGGAS